MFHVLEPSTYNLKPCLFLLAREQCLMGSLTGAVASQRVAEAFKGRLDTDGNRIDSVYA